ncbi:MAG: chromate efflux transporter, partial [Schlesneria sp.]
RPIVSHTQAFGTWCRVAASSFGGPAGQIAVMHRIIVEEKKWISDERFLHALNFCMLLPGPEAQQLATYIGWLMHGTRGALIAGGLFILPGAVSILALSILYTYNEQSSLIQALFFGLKPAIMAIVLEAVFRIGKRVLKNGMMILLAVASFVAIFLFDIPFPLLILLAGMIGLIGGRFWPEYFFVLKGQKLEVSSNSDSSQSDQSICERGQKPSLSRSVIVSTVCLILWFGPLVVIWLTLGPTSVFFQEGAFFSKAAVVTFGGAYSVLAYIAQQAVENYGWLKPGEMLDGLGLAETTPGPLIMVVQFVGFLGAYRNPGPFSPLIAGILGSAITTWVTFVPCFFWILLGAPYVERLRDNKLIRSALSAITAAVVGVILNLAIWFSLHTLFREVTTLRLYGMRLQIPHLTTLNVAEAVVAILACLITFYWKKGMLLTLTISTSAGATWFLSRAWLHF